MNVAPALDASEVFFLEVDAGQRFCLYHPPRGANRRGTVLYVHPFAEEMNKSRRMAALQARSLAEAGFGVLQMDLAGCGDSSGDFVDARWDIWLADLAAAHQWLAARQSGPFTILGLRLGALLAVEYATSATLPLARLALWQPVQQGAGFLKQFLRLRMASDMLTEEAASAPADSSGGTAALRAALLAGATLEVGGYELHGALAAAIDHRDLATLAPPPCPVDWFDVSTSLERPPSPALVQGLSKWRQRGVDATLHRVAGPAFWSTQEIELCADLHAATTAALCEHDHVIA